MNCVWKFVKKNNELRFKIRSALKPFTRRDVNKFLFKCKKWKTNRVEKFIQPKMIFFVWTTHKRLCCVKFNFFIWSFKISFKTSLSIMKFIFCFIFKRSSQELFYFLHASAGDTWNWFNPFMKHLCEVDYLNEKIFAFLDWVWKKKFRRSHKFQLA